jgi:TRAP-type C4-dicarboxylate transport system permease small subunit
VSFPEPSRWEGWADRLLGLASSILLLLLMAITVADVLLRYLFSAPLRGAFEVTEILLLVLIFAGLPLVSRADEHVTMDFVDRAIGPQALGFVIRAAHAGCAALLLALAWFAWLKAGKIAAYADTTESLKIPVAPFVYFMAVMIALAGLIHVWKIFVPGSLTENGPDRAVGP